jgi:hypothetical protein
MLPTASYALPDIDTVQPHGVLLITATLDTIEDFDPVVTRPVTDTALPEPELNPEIGWMPARPFVVNNAGESPRLAATFALFNARTSELRLIKEATIKVLGASSANTDYVPPQISNSSVVIAGQQVAISAEVSDSDSEVNAVYATFISSTDIWTVPLARDADDLTGEIWTWDGNAAAPWFEVSYFIQAVDRAGNVGLAAAKSDYLSVDLPTLYLPLVFRQ